MMRDSMTSSSPFSGSLAHKAFVVALLAVLTVAALALRLSGIGFLLPSVVEPDGGVLPYQLERFETGVANPSQDFYAAYYPTAIARVARLWPSRRAALEKGERLGVAESVVVASDYNLRVRKTVAVLSVLVVPITYFVARFVLSSGWSLVAAAFMALSFLQAWFAQQSRPHAAATSAFTLCMLAALHLRKRGTLAAYLFAALAFGLAVGTLQNGIAFGLPIVAALLLRERDAKSRGAWWILPAFAIAGAIAWSLYPRGATPEVKPDAPLFEFDRAADVLKLSGHDVYLQYLNFDGVKNVANALTGYEPVLTAVCLVGLICFVVRLSLRPGAPAFDHPRDVWVMLSFVAPYAFVLCVYQLSYQRFVIPLLPYLACFAAWTLSSLVGWLSNAKRSTRAVAAALVCLPLGAQATFAVRLAQVRAEPDTVARATEWFRDEHNFDRTKERLVVAPPLDLALPQEPELLSRNSKGVFVDSFPWLRLQTRMSEEQRPLERYRLVRMPLAFPADRKRASAAPLEFVRTLNADFAVVHTLEVTRFDPSFAAVRDALLSDAQLVARFAPDDEGAHHEIPLDYEDFEHFPPLPWAWRTLFAHSTGPVVEIYKLARPAERKE